jgi:hypothetical protein
MRTVWAERKLNSSLNLNDSTQENNLLTPHKERKKN